MAAVVKARRVVDQALEPRKLVVELRAGLRIAVGQIETPDQHAMRPPPRCSGCGCRPCRPAGRAGFRSGPCPSRGSRRRSTTAVRARSRHIPRRGFRRLGNAVSGAFSSCRHATSGASLSSHSSSAGRRERMPLTLKVAILSMVSLRSGFRRIPILSKHSTGSGETRQRDSAGTRYAVFQRASLTVSFFGISFRSLNVSAIRCW